MDIFSVISLLGGLAFFLFGMNIMSSGLEKMAGGKLERTLKRMTSNPFKSLVLGAGITIAIQSSSAMTVMLVGLVNSGIMQLGQTVGVLMGSNIGTTLTAWLLSLTGIESDVILLQLLKPVNFAPIFALVGIMMVMLSKKTKHKDIGTILVGFAILMSGMTIMSDAVSPLADSPQFSSVLTAFENPLLGVLIGTLFTGIIQSSAASVGILQALALTGSVTYGMAIPIIMGQNIGTCVTSLISSIGVNKNAKRVSVLHILFNVIGTVVFLVLYLVADSIFKFAFLDLPIDIFGIAFCHSVFNVATTAMLFPFQKKLVRLAEILVKDKKGEKETYTFLDERLLNTPSFAISECNNITIEMSEIALRTIIGAIDMFEHYDQKKLEKVLADEERLDMYEDKLGSYLIKLSSKELSDKDSREISKLLHTISDFERIGDHAVNLIYSAREMHEKKLDFSPEALEELKILTAAIREILTITTEAFRENNLKKASRVEPLEQVVDGLIMEIKSRHIERLRKGVCTIELGFVLTDILTNYARASDHCSNIAVALIEVSQDSFDTHEYLGVVRSQDMSFKENFKEYNLKYHL